MAKANTTPPSTSLRQKAGWLEPKQAYKKNPTDKPRNVAKSKVKRCKLSDLPQRVPGGIEVRYNELKLAFHHLDGMYSYCTVMEGKSKGQPFHLSRATPLIDRGEYFDVELE